MAIVVISTQPLNKMKELKVKLDDKEIVVKKLPLGRYAELLKQIRKLPKHLQDLPNLDNQTILEHLPEIFESSQDDVFGLIAVATDLTLDEIKEMDLYEATKVVLAVFEVNRYKEVYDMIKKATAHPQPQPAEIEPAKKI